MCVAIKVCMKVGSVDSIRVDQHVCRYINFMYKSQLLYITVNIVIYLENSLCILLQQSLRVRIPLVNPPRQYLNDMNETNIIELDVTQACVDSMFTYERLCVLCDSRSNDLTAILMFVSVLALTLAESTILNLKVH